MLHDVIRVKAMTGYKLFLRFDDGTSGQIDISKLVPFKGVFAKLQDKKYFSTVAVNRDIGTIWWKNGADLSLEFLYKKIIKKRK